MGKWNIIKKNSPSTKSIKKEFRKVIKKAAKEFFPDRGYKEEFYLDEAKQLEQPAFIEGAKWAIKELNTQPSDYVEGQIELLKWLQDQIGTDYSLSPHETYEQLVERFNKGRK